MLNPELREYVEREILPRYDHFDTAHRRDHVDTVISAVLELAKHYDVNRDMARALELFPHDTDLLSLYSYLCS